MHSAYQKKERRSRLVAALHCGLFTGQSVEGLACVRPLHLIPSMSFDKRRPCSPTAGGSTPKHNIGDGLVLPPHRDLWGRFQKADGAGAVIHSRAALLTRTRRDCGPFRGVEAAELTRNSLLQDYLKYGATSEPNIIMLRRPKSLFTSAASFITPILRVLTYSLGSAGVTARARCFTAPLTRASLATQQHPPNVTAQMKSRLVSFKRPHIVSLDPDFLEIKPELILFDQLLWFAAQRWAELKFILSTASQQMLLGLKRQIDFLYFFYDVFIGEVNKFPREEMW